MSAVTTKRPRPWEQEQTASKTILQEPENNFAKRTAIIIWISIAVLIGWFIWTAFIGPLTNFHPVTKKLLYQRDIGGPQIANPSSEVFSLENVLQYTDKGNGLQLRLQRRYRNLVDLEKVITILPFKTANDNRKQREKEIENAKGQIAAALNEINTDPPRENAVYMIVDVTEGMYPDLHKQVRDTFGLLKLESSVTAGNGVRFNSMKISASDVAYENRQPEVTIPVGANQQTITEGIAQVHSRFKWLTDKHSEERETSVLSAFFKYLSETKKGQSADVYVFSDFLENKPGYTFTMYSGEGRKLLEDDNPRKPDSQERREQKYQELRKLAQKYFPVPSDLHGVYIEIHTPPKGPAGLIHRSTAFIEKLLKEAGAEVKVI